MPSKSSIFFHAILVSMIACNPGPSHCESGNCVNGSGSAVFENGDLYTGEFEGGTMNGFGLMAYDDNIVYEGQFEGGRRNGLGSMSVAPDTLTSL